MIDKIKMSKQVCIFTLTLLVFSVLVTKIFAQNCEIQPFVYPVWINDELIAVSGCAGVQIYNNDLESQAFIELANARFTSSSDSGDWLAVIADGNIYLINMHNFEIQYSIEGFQIAWHPEENRFVFASDTTNPSYLRTFDADTQSIQQEQTIDHVASRLIWQSNDIIQYVGIGKFEVYQWHIGEPPQIIFENTAPIEWGIFTRGIWSPDNTSFVFVSRRNYGEQEAMPAYLGVQNVVTDSTYQIAPISHQNFHLSTVMDVSWHPNGEILAVASSNSVALFSAVTFEYLETLSNEPDRILYQLDLHDCTGRPPSEIYSWLAWNPDGTQLIVSSYCGLKILSVDNVGQDNDNGVHNQ